MDFAGWLRALPKGRSFVTNGPLLLLEVDGESAGRDHPAERNRAAPRESRASE